jgi:septum formation protein
MNKTLILASKSPRRQQMLAQLGYEFSIINADIDESSFEGELPIDYVQRVALAKAKRIAIRLSDAMNFVILASDTSVVVEKQILTKPENKAHFVEMMQLLSNKTHQVLTAIVGLSAEKEIIEVVTSEVQFTTLTPSIIEAYWQTGEPVDKAGGYGIQGLAGNFVKRINGSYSSIVGLPLVETAELLAKFSLAPTVSMNNVNKSRNL